MLLFLAAVCMVGAAQAADDMAAVDHVATKRERIRVQRAAVDAEFVKAQQACLMRFAVTDCERHAKRERRAAMDLLRREELTLNDLDRQANATAAINRLTDNLSPEKQRAAEVRRLQAEQEFKTRQQMSDEKKAAKTPTLTLPQPKALDLSSPSPVEAARQQRMYDEKLQQAQQHKEDKLKEAAQAQNSSIKPLPMPAEAR
ncbi:hypothetical protein [Rhodoferax sp.]|uniref:hypothetical protein n=1 Tax=Rhodoferax sp. TaxID=50421 RepID=UPI0026187B77|nr:hypothetical protein [Rhodoferax sp.]MDD5480823.1 hypothetical protein [Rhodoferax sp.]